MFVPPVPPRRSPSPRCGTFLLCFTSSRSPCWLAARPPVSYSGSGAWRYSSRHSLPQPVGSGSSQRANSHYWSDEKGQERPPRWIVVMAFGKRCPLCGSTMSRRIRRTQRMRLIPGSRHYECARCKCRFLHVAWLISVLI